MERDPAEEAPGEAVYASLKGGYIAGIPTRLDDAEIARIQKLYGVLLKGGAESAWEDDDNRRGALLAVRSRNGVEDAVSQLGTRSWPIRSPSSALWLMLALGAQEPFWVYKPVVSQCPASWIDAVSAEVATSEVISLVDVKGLKRSIGIPMALRSCNTSIYGDYVFEGNVPPEAIKSFLAAPSRGGRRPQPA